MNIPEFLSGLLFSLWDLRCNGEDRAISSYAVVLGRIYAAVDLGAITPEEEARLRDLLSSAYVHSFKPYPSRANAGPVMPFMVFYKRREESRAAVSVQLEQVQADEQPVEQVRGQASRPEVRVLCVLGNVLGLYAGKAFPVRASRPTAPFVSRSIFDASDLPPFYFLRVPYGLRHASVLTA